jgi:uncharacterized protein with GYD domain
MPKYLVRANYTQSGLRGLLAEGGTGRKQAVSELIASVGGTVESMYFAFGDTDAFIVVDAPDNVTVAGVTMLVTAAGAATTSVTVLLSPEDMDAATKVAADYRPPGQ